MYNVCILPYNSLLCHYFPQALSLTHVNQAMKQKFCKFKK